MVLDSLKSAVINSLEVAGFSFSFSLVAVKFRFECVMDQMKV